MALIKCHECGKDVSTEASACPSCGAPVKKPLPTAAQQRSAAKPTGTGKMAFYVVVGTFFVVAVGVQLQSSDSTAKTSLAEPAQKTTAQCLQDLQCWGDRNLSKAHVYCKAYIERLALHSVKWTDEGMFDHKFSRFKWLDQAAGTVTYIGDKVEFQNGFAAYTPMIYACDLGDLDKEQPKVLGARVLGEGRLPPS